MSLKSILQEVEQHIAASRMHPDMAQGLRIIATRVEQSFERLLAGEYERARQFYEHVVNGAPHPRDLERMEFEDTERALKALAESYPSEDEAAAAAGVVTAQFPKAEVPAVLAEAKSRVNRAASTATSNVASTTTTAPAVSNTDGETKTNATTQTDVPTGKADTTETQKS